jgi:hypothetical protein
VGRELRAKIHTSEVHPLQISSKPLLLKLHWHSIHLRNLDKERIKWLDLGPKWDQCCQFHSRLFEWQGPQVPKDTWITYIGTSFKKLGPQVMPDSRLGVRHPLHSASGSPGHLAGALPRAWREARPAAAPPFLAPPAPRRAALTFSRVFRYRCSACWVSSRTRSWPSLQGTTMPVLPKHTVTFILPLATTPGPTEQVPGSAAPSPL